MNTPKQDVAVFIDFENIYVSVREKFDATPNFEALMEKCEDYGRVVVARAYADWYRYPRITSALFANNIEPMYVPTYYYDKDEGRTGRPIKNSVDMHMCIDAMRTLYTRTNISKYVFITGDRDFIALVNCVRQEGKDVVIIGIGGAASSHLAQSADEFLFYEQIVDIRPMGHTGRRVERPERSAERPERIERLERIDRPERTERNGRDGRDDRRRDRPERALEKPEPKAVEKPLEQPAEIVAAAPAPAPIVPAERIATPIVAIPTPSSDSIIYDKLIEALELARKRGYVSSFGSLKVLMKELMPNFKESRYRNAQGKPFTKFTDFVREAERLGKIQIFTSGTVNEVFLPDEDPYKLSQFAEDLPSVEAERELEQELAAEAIAEVHDLSESIESGDSDVDETVSAAERVERTNRRRRRRGGQGRGEPALTDLPAGENGLEEEGSSDEVLVFGEREWALFDKVMSAYSEPVPFADIFNDLREMRNTEELDLTNNALKELIKQAINAGKVQRSNRGAKAHYRVVVRPSTSVEPAISEFMLPDLIDEPEAYSANERELPDLIDDDNVAPSMIRGELVSDEPAAFEAPEVAFESVADTNGGPAAETGVSAAEQPAAAPAPKAPRRRRKAEPEAAPAPVAVVEEAKPKPAKRRAKPAAEPVAEPVVQESQPTTPNRRRRKKADVVVVSDTAATAEASTEGVE
jgi:uncharacterized protein (TIGR00288 family)